MRKTIIELEIFNMDKKITNISPALKTDSTMKKPEVPLVYSKKAEKLGHNPENYGALAEFDSHIIFTGPCGDTMEFWIKVLENKIAGISFKTDGCVSSKAAGSMATIMAKGKSLTEILKLEQQDVLTALGGLPENHIHCARLAVKTLQKTCNAYKKSN